MVYIKEPAIDTLILDLDGTLLDGSWRHYTCYSQILNEAGYQPMPFEQYWDLKRQCVDRRQQLAISHAEEIYELFIQKWLLLIEEKEFLLMDKLHENTLNVLANWQAQGKKLILSTLRNNHNNLFWQLDYLKIADFFCDILPCHTTDGIGKANHVLQKLPLNLTSTAWIGDTEIDINAAKHLQVKCCVVSNGLRTEAYLNSLNPDHCAPNIQKAAEWLDTFANSVK